MGAAMISRLFLLLLALLALPAPALADDLQGSWAFRIEEATIFTFDIAQDADGNWHGSWTRPASFRSNGVVFAQMTGSEQLEAMAALEADGTIELAFDDPRPGAVPDIFRFRQSGENQALLTYVGTDLPPYPLIRVAPDGGIGPFDADRIYDRDNAVTQADYVAPDAAIADGQTAPENSQNPRPRVDAGFLDGL
jgi:hypothetical protein